VVEAYKVNTVVRERPCRYAMLSQRTGTVGSKSGTPIPRLPHFQGFVVQEGKGRCEHTCSLPEKDTMKTWTSGVEIGSIPLDTYRERAHKRRKNREALAPSVSPRKARECECLPSPVLAEATQHHHQLCSICRLLPRYGPWLSNILNLDSSSPR
jgi:hypothetical protein